MINYLLCPDVEFVGGPLDGHHQRMALRGELFVGMVTTVSVDRLGIVRRIFALLRRTRQPVRLAIYELDERKDQCRYRYVGTQFACSSQLPYVGRFNPSHHGYSVTHVPG